jgi:hypothetical protein
MREGEWRRGGGAKKTWGRDEGAYKRRTKLVEDPRLSHGFT